MVGLKVIWTETAYKQRNSIFKYWNVRNKNNNYSSKLRKEINNRINQISKFPEIGKLVDFNTNHAVSLGHFSLLYKHVDNSIIITAFWDNRDDPAKLLEILKK